MQDVEYLKKDDRIQFKNTNYKAISEEKVTEAVRKSLVKNNLIIIPVEQVHSKTDYLTTVDVKYRIIDIDTGDSVEVVSSGTGADTQDKGVGKAMTYSYKYMMLRTFAIPTGEDPDKVSSSELDDKIPRNEVLNGAAITSRMATKGGTWTPADTQITFGKYDGATLGEVLIKDKSYVKWLSEKAKDANLRKASTEILLGNSNKKTEQVKITDDGLPEGFEGLEAPPEDLPF